MKKILLIIPVVLLLMMSCAEELTYDSMTDSLNTTLTPGESHTFELVSQVNKVARIGTAAISLGSSNSSIFYDSYTDYSFTIINPSGLVYSESALSFPKNSIYYSGIELPSYMLVGQPINGTWTFRVNNDDTLYDLTSCYVEIVLEF